MVDAILRDLRTALRGFRRAPRFTLLATAAFAVGIGANTAIFTVVDDVLLDPLPFPAAEDVVAISEVHLERGIGDVPAAPAKLDAWAARTDLFRGVAAWRLEERDFAAGAAGDAGEAPGRISVGLVEPELLPVLGVEPALGRGFTADDATRGAQGVVILTHRAWTSWTGADPDAVGGSLVLEGEPRVVVGVLPQGMAWPAEAEILLPLVIDVRESRVSHAYRVLARLRPGVEVEAAADALDRLAERLAAEHPATDAGWGVEVRSLRAALVGDLDRTLLLFQAAVGLVLLVACANVGSLLLVRAGGRRREMAVRTSVGAARWQLVRQLTVESVVLALAGAAVGVLGARVGVALLLGMSPVELPGAAGPGAAGGAGGVDATVLAFTAAVAVASGLIFGLVPAFRGTGRDVMGALRESGGTGGSGATGSPHLRNGIVIGEIALATVLLVGGALFLRSLAAVDHVDPGFEPAGLLAVQVQPPPYRYGSPEERVALYDALRDAIEARPGVASAALASHIPLGGRFDTFRFLVEGRPPPESVDLLVTQMRAVSPGYFATMGTSVLRGRAFEEADRAGAERVAVVNRAMARLHWPGEEVLGQRVSLMGPDGPWIRVVGVVEDVRSFGPTADVRPELFVPMAQEMWPRAELVVRAEAGTDALAVLPGVRAAVAEVDPLLPLASVRTFDALVDRQRAPWRFQAVLAAVFGGVAAGLAVVGVVGLLGYVVQQRRRELAVRRALGAGRGDIRRLVGAGALRLGLAGAALGLAAAALLSGALRGMLYGVEPLDPVSYLGVGACLVGLAVAGAWLPARRAAAVEPSEALRE